MVSPRKKYVKDIKIYSGDETEMKMYYVRSPGGRFWWMEERILPVEATFENDKLKLSVRFLNGGYMFSVDRNAVGQSVFTSRSVALAALLLS